MTVFEVFALLQKTPAEEGMFLERARAHLLGFVCLHAFQSIQVSIFLHVTLLCICLCSCFHVCFHVCLCVLACLNLNQSLPLRPYSPFEGAGAARRQWAELAAADVLCQWKAQSPAVV